MKSIFPCYVFVFNFCLFCIYFWLHWVFLAALRLSLAAARAGYSPVMVHGLLIAVASRCRARSLGLWASGIAAQRSVVAVRQLNCSVACGILVPQPRIGVESSALQGGFLTTGPPGKSHILCFKGTLLRDYV